MSFMRPFFIGPVFIRTALPCSGGYRMERGGMPLHDTVGINCKKGATTENQGSSVKFPPGGSEWTISVGDYVNNSFTALGSSDPREVRLEL